MVKNDTFPTISSDSRPPSAAPAQSAWIRAIAPSLEPLRQLLDDVAREELQEVGQE